MDVVIVEDERLTAERLEQQVKECSDDIDSVILLDSVASAKSWFRDNSPPDLLFLDIHLTDGTGFELLKDLEIVPPIIFTTAYDEYAIKAFNYNSIAYLLKPVAQEDVVGALTKFASNGNSPIPAPKEKFAHIDKVISGDYKRRFLVKVGDQYATITVKDIAYFSHHDGMTYLRTKEDDKQLPIDYSLDQLEDILNPMDFFRINRQYLVSMDSIHQIHTYFNSRLLLKLTPESSDDAIVSRDRVNDFKRWIDC